MVSDFLRSMLSCFDGLRFPDLRLLDRLSDQLVDDFSFNVYTNKKKYAMHETQERMQCNAVLATRSVDQTDKQHSQNYGPKEGCSTEMGFWFLIPFSLKCLHQRRLEFPLLNSSSILR